MRLLTKKFVLEQWRETNAAEKHECARTTEGTIMVEFHREGNELITVRMAMDQAADKQNSILRARG